ncbi:MAG TPA: hypothetical protein VJN22_07345, partial [Candidatus Eremiobacteraceae bacterium]|nr:hypothetical protein [Candidatus Eremiobacteraceae bacterium]
MFSALLAVAVLSSVSPDSRLASLQQTAAFHLYVMPDSSDVKQVTVLASDPTGKATAVRIVYDLSQQTLVILETATPGDTGAPESFDPDALYVNGYPATY